MADIFVAIYKKPKDKKHEMNGTLDSVQED